MAEATIPQEGRISRPKTARVERGIALFRERGDEIEQMGRGWYRVPGCSGGTYTVYLAVLGGEECCDCPDFGHREQVCKHVYAATMHRAQGGASRRCDGKALREERRDKARVVLAGLERMGA